MLSRPYLRRGVAAVAAAALLLSSVSGAAAPSAALGPEVDAIFAGMDGKAPGCAVSVSQDGKLLVRRAYGAASLELDVPIAPETIFEAGSASKQFVAATVLRLVREGRIGLSDDIRKYLPEMPDYGAVITIADLLHHTSGLRDWGSLGALQGWPRNSRAAANADALAIVARQRALNFAPGSHFLYSNSNYNLLVIIIERAARRPFGEVSRAEIFAPLGMSNTRWRSNYRDLVPGRAAAYGRDAHGYYNEQVIEDAYGNGGLLTTIDDLARWHEALDRDAFGPGFTEQMQAKGRLRSGQAIGYGMGLYIARYRGWLEVFHEGLTGGYHAWTARYPERKLAIRMLCNASDIPTRPLGRRIADLLLPSTPAPSAPSRPVRAGTYADLMTGIPVRIETDASGALRVDGRVAEPAGGDRWQIPDDIFDFTSGTLVRETIQGERFAYRLVAAPERLQRVDYAGRYCSAEAQSCLVVRFDAGELTLTGPRGTARPLNAAYGDVFTSSIYPSDQKVTLAFERSPSGTVTGLRTSDRSAYGVAFTREAQAIGEGRVRTP
jgi:CubicO group peptidase (beta-lactamase class C family)